MPKRPILIILILAVLATITGCDSGTYCAEKRFWHAEKDFNRLAKDTSKATAVDYQRVIDKFREITIRYPMWPNSARAQFNIGLLYAEQGNLSKSRDEFSAIVKDYPENKDICSRALFMVSLTYESEGEWAKAQASLNKIMSDYPDTETAMQVPIHIAEYYKVKGRNAEAETAYTSALDKYKKMVSDAPKTYGALAAVDLIVTCYADQEKWDEAVEYLNSLVAGYADSLLAPKALFILGAIYEQKFNQPGKAIEQYRQIIDKYPKTPFATESQKRIAALGNPQ